MNRVAVEVALLPGDIVYLRSRNTKRAAVAEVLEVTVFGSVHVRIVLGYCEWDGDTPVYADVTGDDAVLVVEPWQLEDIQY